MHEQLRCLQAMHGLSLCYLVESPRYCVTCTRTYAALLHRHGFWHAPMALLACHNKLLLARSATWAGAHIKVSYICADTCQAVCLRNLQLRIKHTVSLKPRGLTGST